MLSSTDEKKRDPREIVNCNTHHTLPQTSVFGASQLSPYHASSAATHHPSGTHCEAFPPAPQLTSPDDLAQLFWAEGCFGLLPFSTPSAPIKF